MADAAIPVVLTMALLTMARRRAGAVALSGRHDPARDGAKHDIDGVSVYRMARHFEETIKSL